MYPVCSSFVELWFLQRREMWRDVILHITSGLCTEHAHCAGLVCPELAKMATIVTLAVGFVLYHWVYTGLPILNITLTTVSCPVSLSSLVLHITVKCRHLSVTITVFVLLLELLTRCNVDSCMCMSTAKLTVTMAVIMLFLDLSLKCNVIVAVLTPLSLTKATWKAFEFQNVYPNS